MRPERSTFLWVTCLYVIDTLCALSPLEPDTMHGIRGISPSIPPDTHKF